MKTLMELNIHTAIRIVLKNENKMKATHMDIRKKAILMVIHKRVMDMRDTTILTTTTPTA